MFLLKPMHSYQPLHWGNLEIFFIRWVIKSLNKLRWPEFLHRLKFSRWNQSLCSSLSYGIPSGVYVYIICPIYGPGRFPYTFGQSHRGFSQYRNIGFIFNSSKIFYCYNWSIYIFFFSGPASASTISATKPHLSLRTSCICSPRALDNPELDSLDEHN